MSRTCPFFYFLRETDSSVRLDPTLYIHLCVSMRSSSPLVSIPKLPSRPPEMNGATAQKTHASPPSQPQAMTIIGEYLPGTRGLLALSINCDGGYALLPLAFFLVFVSWISLASNSSSPLRTYRVNSAMLVATVWHFTLYVADLFFLLVVGN
jgi:hypothetical protein